MTHLPELSRSSLTRYCGVSLSCCTSHAQELIPDYHLKPFLMTGIAYVEDFVFYAAISLKIQSADRIFVFLSADEHHFVGRLKLLHKRQTSPITLKSRKTLQSANRRPITFESGDDWPTHRPMKRGLFKYDIGRRIG